MSVDAKEPHPDAHHGRPARHQPQAVTIGVGTHAEVDVAAEFAWEAFFFLAFVAKLPNGNLVPLSTMYWDIKHHETVPPGGAGSPGGTSSMNAGGKRCPGCRNCDEGEPGFLPLGPASVTCNNVVLPLANLPARDLTGTLPVKGPGDFKI